MKRAFAFFLVCLVLTGYISAAGEAVSVEEFVASEAMEEPAAEIELELFEESSPTQAAPETELMAPAVYSRASASVVLPTPPWPTMVRLRIFLA